MGFRCGVRVRVRVKFSIVARGLRFNDLKNWLLVTVVLCSSPRTELG